jgi:hypothetical protein
MIRLLLGLVILACVSACDLPTAPSQIPFRQRPVPIPAPGSPTTDSSTAPLLDGPVSHPASATVPVLDGSTVVIID